VFDAFGDVFIFVILLWINVALSNEFYFWPDDETVFALFCKLQEFPPSKRLSAMMERSWREGPGEGSHLTEYALSLHDKKTQPPATRIGDLLSASSGNGSNTRRFSTTGSSAHVSPITRKEVSPNKSLFFQSFKKQTGPITDHQRERSLSSLSLPKIFNLTEVDNLSSNSSPIRSLSMISFGFKEVLEDEEPRDVTVSELSGY